MIEYIDPTNRDIINVLRRAPQSTTRQVAREVGIAELTAANRIDDMIKAHKIKFGIQKNISAFGFNTLAIIDIVISGRLIDDITSELTGISEIYSIATFINAPQISIILSATSIVHLREILDGQIRNIAGLGHIDVSVILKCVHMRSGIGVLAGDVSRRDSEDPLISDVLNGSPQPSPLDDVDKAIIKQLSKDGRISNRAIGRVLKLSEGAIRKRLKRMTDMRVIVHGLLVDVDASGYSSSGWLDVSTTHEKSSEIAQKIVYLGSCTFCADATGSANIRAWVYGRDALSIAKKVEIVSEHKGVISVNYRPSISYPFHRWERVFL